MLFELTPSQRSFYTGESEIDTYLWNQGVMQVFPCKYSYEELNNAFNTLVKNNDSLRVKMKHVERAPVMCLECYSYRMYPRWVCSSMAELENKAKEFLNSSIDFSRDLVRCAIFETPDASGIVISGHHIVVDGYSVIVMAEHLNEYLKNPLYTPPAYQSYSEYVEGEEEYRITRRYQLGKDFWRSEFTPKPVCSLFSDSISAIDYVSSEENTLISSSLFDRIKKFCIESDISVQSFFNTVYSVYFYRTTEHNGFTLGIPVLNRTTAAELNTIGLYMHIVPLVVEIDSGTFLDNALKVENSQLNLFRYQKFTQTEIIKTLQESGTSVNRLFDVATDFQQFEYDSDYEIKVPYCNYLSLPLEIHMQSFGKAKHQLKIRYRTSMFTKKEIQTMINSIVAIAEDALEHSDKKISELNMLSADEQKLLNSFNNTASPYDKEKCIHELFEEQVKKTPDKVALVAADKALTYKELNEEANRIAHSLMEKGIGSGDIVGLMLPRKSYLLSALLGILKTGAAYLPIDSELPSERIEYMCKDTNAVLVVSDENIKELLEASDVSDPCTEMTNDALCYCIYTSGSTGQPKGVMAMHGNVVNYISKNEHNIAGKIITDDFEAIVSISTCSFDIFVTETILPLVNGLRVVLADEQQCRNQTELSKLLSREKGDFLQTTPTKLKVLTADPKQREFLRNVRAILLGGEAMETSYLNELRQLTDAKIYNIYGTTEVPIWSTFADTDTFTDAVTIGKPIANTQVHILDKHLKPVPVGVTGELCIAGDSVSAGYLNRPEQTAERFIDNPFGEGKLYRTGDNAFWREDGNIVYVGRSDFQVKIRGLRIELGEIESALQNIEGIERAVVVVRKNSEDRQLICAFYTGEERPAKDLRAEMGASLPKYMLPHIFTRLDEMPLTASGKANRNALPEIDLENISTDAEYAAPVTEREIILTECVEKVLNNEKTSVLDNFFDIGGDSLKAIELTARLEEKGYTVAVKTIFSCKDIRELAERLEEAKAEYVKAEYDSVLPATSAQMRVYTAQMLKPESTVYNITHAFKTDKVDKDRLERAVNKLIERHESLRTRFENRNGQIVQIIEEKANIAVEEITDEEINSFVKPFELSKAPLVRVGCSENTVIISLHHISVDGESSPVFFRELNELYMERELSGEAVQYGEFAVTDSYTEENEKYWLNVFSDEAPQLEIPKDRQRGAEQFFNGNVHYRLIEKKLHERIEEMSKARGITPYVYYMACLSMLLSKLSGNEDIVIGTPMSGRSARYLNTVGMFVNTVALRSRPDGNKTVAELLSEIRDSSVEAIENQNYPFGELVRRLNISTAGRNPMFDVMLAYQSYELTDITFGDKKAELIPLEGSVAKCDMSFHILPRKDDVVLATEYCTDLFDGERIVKFAEMYNSLLEQCLDDSKLIRDISVTDTALLATFNNTSSPYDKDKCIHELFEEQVKKTPDKVALVAADKALTYKELNEEANRIAHSLMEKGIGRGDIVGLMLPRKSYLLSALLGILKTGAAYLPIDPEHPAERIEYILSDSRAKYCITDENIFEFLSNSDVTNPIIETNSNDICYCIYTSGSTGKPKGALIYHRNLVWYMSVLENIYGTENINMPFFTSQSVDLTVPSFCFPLLTGGTTYLYNGELKDDLIDIFNNDELTMMKFTPTHMNIICNTVPSKLRPNIRCIIVGGETLYREACFEFLNKFGNHIEIHNEYGPTETTVSCTDFIFNPGENKNMQYLPIGRPVANTQIYILDKHMNPVTLGVTGEVCIAGDGVGAGYLNNPELTAEKFVDNPFGDGKLYRTGDNAYWCEDGNIVFVGRNDFQVKIRGLRIELGEIESALQNIEGIERAVVVVRKNSEDRQLICAFYTGEERSAKDLRAEMGASLPKYMLPHIFTRLDEMPLTASGKVNRNALPEIDLECISTETEHKAPETEEEKALSEAVCSVLNVSSINMLDNFFNIGGDSIRAIYIVAELADMGYELRVADIMQSDTFSDAAEFVKAAYDNAVYEQNEVNGLMPFSPIMRAFLKRSNTIPENYVHTCVFEADCDEITAKKALDVLVSHHDILRGVFRDNGIQVVPSDERKAYSFEVLTIDDADKAKDYLNKAKISKDKLVNIVFCNTKKENLISMTVHHFLIDLVSWEILIKDFQTAVRQINNKEQILLPAKTASFMLWCEELQKYSETISAESKAYWEDVNQKLNNTKSVNFNVYAENEAEEYNFTFDENVSNKLINEVTNVYGARINEVLLTALGLAVGKITGGSAGIIVESHGRTELEKHIAVERTVGWFTSCYPVIIDNNDEVEALINTKETLRRIPKNGIDYLLLNEGFNENTDVKFNFYRSNTAEDASGNKLMAFNYEMSVFPGFTNVNCFIEDNILSVNISVPYGRHREMLAKELTEEFVKQTERLVEICTGTDIVVRTLSDFSDNELTEDELDELKDLFDWTDANEQ